MGWKCDVCLVTNDQDAKVCVCCEYPRDKDENKGQKNAVVFNANLNLPDSGPVFTFGLPTNNQTPEIQITEASTEPNNGVFSDKQMISSFSTDNFTSGFVPKSDNIELTPSTPISTPLIKEINQNKKECDEYYLNFNSEFLEYKKLVGRKPDKYRDDTDIKLPLGSVWVWGSGECDQLGIKESLLDEDLSLKVPMRISDLSNEYNIVDVCSGALHNIILTDQGEVLSWGCNDDGALGRTSFKLKKKLERRDLSDDEEEDTEEEDEPNEDDLLGDKYPNKVEFTDEENGHKTKVNSIVSGDCYSCCLTDSGEVFLWGSYKDSGGYIGFPNYSTMCGSIVGYKQYKPVKVPIFGVNNQRNKKRKISKNDNSNKGNNSDFLEKAIKIVGGENHTIVITENNRIFAWGSTEFGQYGIEPVVDNKDYSSEMNKTKYLYPIELTNRTLGFEDHLEIQDVFCGRASTFFVVNNKIVKKIQVYSCGRNGRNELGICKIENINNPGENDPIVSRPRKVVIDDFDLICKDCGSNKPIKSIGGGQYYSALLTCCGNVYTWGMKECCGLEMCGIKNKEICGVDINERDIKIPTKIDQLKEIAYLGFGADNCFAIDNNGLIFSWGLNLTGQIGIKKFENTEAVLNPHLIDPRSFSEGLFSSKNEDYNYALKVTGGSQHSIALIWNGLYSDEINENESSTAERGEFRRMNAKSFGNNELHNEDKSSAKQDSSKKSKTSVKSIKKTRSLSSTKPSKSSSKEVDKKTATVAKNIGSSEGAKGNLIEEKDIVKSSKSNNTRAKNSKTKTEKNTDKGTGSKTIKNTIKNGNTKIEAKKESEKSASKKETGAKKKTNSSSNTAKSGNSSSSSKAKTTAKANAKSKTSTKSTTASNGTSKTSSSVSNLKSVSKSGKTIKTDSKANSKTKTSPKSAKNSNKSTALSSGSKTKATAKGKTKTRTKTGNK
ncbi:hypothetical protein FG386_001290 [Cryptosporidium ryanae]|uniref:uncharacterized protein n=1 Tax=Cryptosporidium ryanae TaxID=515981 RepID=UPI00351A3A5C|nr:hypothetical protein FG386_001290 [Cryptosporidium ryanae]